MKSVIAPVVGLTVLLLGSCSLDEKPDPLVYVPSLEAMDANWVSVDTVDMEPSLRNFRAQALVNKDMVSLSWLADAPYSGGYHTGTLQVDGETPLMTHFRWQPYQALRKSVQANYEINSATRMIPDEPVVLWDVQLKNTQDSSRRYELSLDHIGFMNAYPGREWQWWYPYPTLDSMTTKRDDIIENMRDHLGTGIYQAEADVVELINGVPTPTRKLAKWPTDLEVMASTDYHTEVQNQVILVTQVQTGTVTGFKLLFNQDTVIAHQVGATSRFTLTANPGETVGFRYAMAWGKDATEVQQKLDAATTDFTTQWNNIASEWQRRWKALFTPGNDILSAAFPILKTPDSLARRVYYTGPLTMLYLMNTHLPEHKKVFLTGGPRWGASITFFWDVTEWSTLWATVDPEMMKEHLLDWVRIDPSKNYGKDNFGGQGVGNGYSANFWALFQLIRAYVTVTGDFAFLHEEVEGKSILQHLDDYATNWERISIYQEGMDEVYKLADFGDDEWNLLECVPTYKHIVPSFNAGYIWMMRGLADFYRQEGQNDRAQELDEKAQGLVTQLLKLYAGNGVWYSLYPDGSKIEVRHSLDFMFMGRYIPKDIPPKIKEEMMDFVYRELMVDHWMRAQSVEDVAAADSDRPDHGPLGAFDGWPAGTMDALVQLGFPHKALDFYHAIEPVTHEGIWAQAHEIWGENKWKHNGKVRIAKRGWHNRESSAGIAMSQVMLKDFFGFYPGVSGDPICSNGDWTFDGTLFHVRYRGVYYTLTQGNKGVVMTKE